MRWILIFSLLTIGLGIFLREGGEIPWPYFDWVGHLPGDLIITKNGVEIYFPMATCFLFSLSLSLLFSLCRKKSGA